MDHELTYQELAHRKKIRTYSKRFFTVLSAVLSTGYVATLVCRIPDFSIYFAAVGAVVSIISLTLNMWSLTDHFRKKELDEKHKIQEKTSGKLTKICLDITSSGLFVLGGIILVLPSDLLLPFNLLSSLGLPIVSTPFFALGYAIMAVNCTRSIINSLRVDQHCNNNEGITV
ncbi:MAG TPA: hypothetical protein DEQ74_02815 [Wolbachia sp.]|jgi:hypothetical protein|uniref:hypothetical protein n=1 Tax=Wolbachia endosymbiont of Pentalonia nigronervosa TaxID=1301914 RepID=UPI000EEF3DAC|nr:hypothetical protein [Wolbachia endosymbiont of Pentalonia nigronervosa]MBD0391036.1 hypothetical protein [Wolbachia endosymbiont of Pentalonia nigronervosa]HCE59735.1 hypothetical protein [Wolbachia sp.]